MVLQETLCVAQGRQLNEIPHVDTRKMMGATGPNLLQHQLLNETWVGPETETPVPDEVNSYYDTSASLLQVCVWWWDSKIDNYLMGTDVRLTGQRL